MKYIESTYNKIWFLVTPSELEKVLSGFHLVITNTGVKKDYSENNFDDYIRSYENLYRFLCSGQKAEWEANYDLFRLEIGITKHLKNIIYKPSTLLSVPDFVQPCVTMGPFCVIPYGDAPLTKGWALHQFPENTIGLVIRFPKKVRFCESDEEQKADALDDYETWIELKNRIRSITVPLKIKSNGKEYNPHIRISKQAKTDLQCFYVKKSLGFETMCFEKNSR